VLLFGGGGGGGGGVWYWCFGGGFGGRSKSDFKVEVWRKERLGSIEELEKERVEVGKSEDTMEEGRKGIKVVGRPWEDSGRRVRREIKRNRDNGEISRRGRGRLQLT
jgi:hypothetical protein